MLIFTEGFPYTFLTIVNFIDFMNHFHFFFTCFNNFSSC